MNANQFSSTIRMILNLLAGFIVASTASKSQPSKDFAGVLVNFINGPDALAVCLGAVSWIWGMVTHSGTPPPPAGTGGPRAALLLCLVLPSLVFTGCAGTNANVFTAERSAAVTSDAALRAYAVYWTKAEANPVAYHRTLAGLDSERATIEAASIKIGASIELAENLRVAYATNSAVQPQLNAAVSTLAANAAGIVTLVNTFTSVTSTNQ